MNWATKVVHNKPDEFVHAKLMKYGIGEHPGPRVFLKLSKARITFKADLDMEKAIIRAYLNNVPSPKHKVKGLVVSYDDRRDEFNIRMPISWKVSKGKGATTYKAKLSEVAPLEDIKELVEKDDPTTFFLLSLSPSDGTKPWSVTTKTSFPKAPKGGDDEEDEKDPNFTKGALENQSELLDKLLDDLVPEAKGKITDKTKVIELRQTLHIDDIEIPDDPNMSFAEKRKAAKKKGRLIRKVTIDKDEFENEYSFLA